jgi:hypothetical protein
MRSSMLARRLFLWRRACALLCLRATVSHSSAVSFRAWGRSGHAFGTGGCVNPEFMLPDLAFAYSLKKGKSAIRIQIHIKPEI